MKAHPLVSVVHDDWLENAPSLRLDIDQDRARALGVSSLDVRRTLQASFSGLPLAQFRDKDETISIVLREPADARGSADHGRTGLRQDGLGRIGAAVAGRHGAKIVMEPSIEWRRDRLPSITVRGLVPDNVQSPDVTNAIYAQLKPLRDSLPLGYSIEMQGAVEESAISQDFDQRQDAGDGAGHRAAADDPAAACRQDRCWWSPPVRSASSARRPRC